MSEDSGMSGVEEVWPDRNRLPDECHLRFPTMGIRGNTIALFPLARLEDGFYPRMMKWPLSTPCFREIFENNR